MTEKNGIVTFECDKDCNGNEIENSSQRNNELIWPSVTDKPNAQYRTFWKNMCNTTSYIMFLEYAGYKFPAGPYEQPEDNLAYHILTSKAVLDKYAKECPSMYLSFLRSLEGQCSQKELENMYFPNELHDYLCFGANEWIGTTAAVFSTKTNFKKILWRNMVLDNLPLVISTNFGGNGHIVCVTGVQYKKEDWIAGKSLGSGELPEITPVAIIVDDPWGKYNSETNKYDAPNGGNDIIVPWKRVISSVKPYGSETVKWTHSPKHAIPTI